MSSENLSLLIEMALDFSKSVRAQDTEQELISAVRKLVPCDAIAILDAKDDSLVPKAAQGLSLDTLGRRFAISEHPRFAVLCKTKNPYVFPPDCELPDPYDGLLMSRSGDLPVHSCLGIPLRKGDDLIGLITIDSLDTEAFSSISHKTLEVIANLGTQALLNARLVDTLKTQADTAQTIVQELNEEALFSGGGEIIGASRSITKLKQDVSLVAGSEFNVLITGETGVGKELVARTLHHQSNRRMAPLVHVNCAALTESLAEAELFGHTKGAFTGADTAREGKFKLADNGTLFLDEVGELPLSIQSKLLRSIQSGEIQRVGEDKVSYVNVRVVAATNRNLEQEVELGRFRADLYHRLAVYPIHVPALRERDTDAVLIAGYFIERTRRNLGLRQLKLSPEASERLVSYVWPGNVRELEHMISRASLNAKASQGQNDIVVISDDLLELQGGRFASTNSLDSPSENDAEWEGQSLKTMTESFQRQQIMRALSQHQGNWAKAASSLSHDRANLMRLAKRLGVVVEKSVRVTD